MKTAVILCVLASTFALSGAEDDGFVIGARKNRIWFAPGMKDDAFHKEALEAAKLLNKGKLEYEGLSELTEGLQRDKNRSAKVFGGFLDARKTSDAGVRFGAVKALELTNPESAAVGKELAAAAILEKDERVRGAVVELIRTRKDTEAARGLVKQWHAAFEDEALGVDEALRTAAENAMRDVGDRRIYEAIYYYVTMELRAQTATLDRMDTARIRDAGRNVQANDRGGNINLPIDLPSITLSSVETTLVVPALPSLKRITGQDFGRDLPRWKAWIAAQPEMRP